MPQVQERLEVEFDEDGLLLNPSQWNEAVAQQIAWHDGIGQLSDEHWKAIYALREHYAKFGVAPAMTHLCRVHGKDRHWIHDLFHSCLGAWRVAGLPNPGEEAKAYMMQFRRDDRFAMCRCAISVAHEDWRDIRMTE